MTALTKMSLDELYARSKITTATERAIRDKSDFTAINQQWCQNICRLKCKTPQVVDLINSPVDILIIQDHEAPAGKFDKREGQQESIQRQVINFIAKRAGLHQFTFRIISLLKCPASKEDFPNGKPPTQTTLQKCFPYLEEEIKAANPKAIISLGTATTKALGLTKHSNTGNRGEIAFSKYGVPVVITLHPKILTFIRQNARGAAGMWGPDYMPVIERDFAKAAKLASGELRYSPATLQESVKTLVEKQITICKSIEDVRKLVERINRLPEGKIVSFDTETTSLDPLDPKLKLLSIQFGWRQDDGTLVAGVIPLWHRENAYYDADEAWELVHPILTGPRRKVGHNSKYDILVIYWSKGVRVVNVVFDTLLLAHSICSGAQGTYGLKSAVWDRLTSLGIGGYEDQLGDLKALKRQLEKAQGQVDVDEMVVQEPELVLSNMNDEEDARVAVI